MIIRKTFIFSGNNMFIQFLEWFSPGHGAYAMLLPFGLTLAGWSWFIRLHRNLKLRRGL